MASPELHSAICGYLKALIDANSPRSEELEVALDVLSAAWELDAIQPSLGICDLYKSHAGASTQPEQPAPNANANATATVAAAAAAAASASAPVDTTQMTLEEEILTRRYTAEQADEEKWNQFEGALAEQGILSKDAENYATVRELARTKYEARKAENASQADEFKAKGNAEFQGGNLDEADLMYSRAIELDKTNAIYFSNRSAVRVKLGRFPDAIADAEQAIALDTSYIKAYNRLGRALADSGDYEQALRVFNRAVEIDPSNSTSTAGQAECAAKANAAGGASGGAAPGQPDLANLAANVGNMFGGAEGLGGLAQNLMSNPQVAQMMSDPNLMQSMQGMMQNMDPSVMANLANAFGGAQPPQ